MSEHLDHARRYQEAIHGILLREWDPIGIAEIPEAQNEYDDYIYEIYGMLIRHEPWHRLFDHLWWVETEHMALFGNRRRTEHVTDRLIGLQGQIETDSWSGRVGRASGEPPFAGKEDLNAANEQKPSQMRPHRQIQPIVKIKDRSEPTERYTDLG